MRRKRGGTEQEGTPDAGEDPGELPTEDPGECGLEWRMEGEGGPAAPRRQGQTESATIQKPVTAPEGPGPPVLPVVPLVHAGICPRLCPVLLIPGRAPTLLLLEKAYRARGFSRRLMTSMASSRPFTFMMGRMGPKISSCITSSVSCTSTSTVGAARAQGWLSPGLGPRVGPRDPGLQARGVLGKKQPGTGACGAQRTPALVLESGVAGSQIPGVRGPGSQVSACWSPSVTAEPFGPGARGCFVMTAPWALGGAVVTAQIVGSQGRGHGVRQRLGLSTREPGTQGPAQRSRAWAGVWGCGVTGPDHGDVGVGAKDSRQRSRGRSWALQGRGFGSGPDSGPAAARSGAGPQPGCAVGARDSPM